MSLLCLFSIFDIVLQFLLTLPVKLLNHSIYLVRVFLRAHFILVKTRLAHGHIMKLHKYIIAWNLIYFSCSLWVEAIMKCITFFQCWN